MFSTFVSLTTKMDSKRLIRSGWSMILNHNGKEFVPPSINSPSILYA